MIEFLLPFTSSRKAFEKMPEKSYKMLNLYTMTLQIKIVFVNERMTNVHQIPTYI